MATSEKSSARPREASSTLTVTPHRQVNESLPLAFADPEPAAPALQPVLPLKTLWLGIDLPVLPLEALSVTPGPAAVIEEQQGVRRLLLMNQRAGAEGIQPGMLVNAALALSPGLELLERDPLKEARVLKELAAWAEKFTSLICIETPALLLLEIAGSLTLFGGLRALRQRIVDGLESQGFSNTVAIAPTPLAATWLARSGQRICIRDPRNLVGRLGSLPLSCLGWPVGVTDLLKGMGVTRVGEALRLPRAGFAKRFGAIRLLELDRALGRLPDPRTAYRTPERFIADFDLNEEQSDAGLILNACRELLVGLERFLRGRQAAVQAIDISFFHLREPATHLSLGCVQADRAVVHWFDLLELRFEKLSLAAPVIAVRLCAGETQSFETANAVLPFSRDDRVTGSVPVAHLAERLSARIGKRSVHGVLTVAEHRPQYAWKTSERYDAVPRCDHGVQSILYPRNDESLVEGRGTKLYSQTDESLVEGRRTKLNPQDAELLAEIRRTNSLVLRRPLWVLEEPCRLELEGRQPCYDGPLKLLSGPERLESGWWDGKGIARDYFVAVNPAGVHLWIYRNRHGRRDWYLHGKFGVTVIERTSQYAELHALSNFTFLRGASHPEELVDQASALGYQALAITDECSVSGVVRAHMAAREHDIGLVTGAEFRLLSGLKIVVLARNRRGYGQLCSLITRGRRAAEKGSYRLSAEDFVDGLKDCFVLWVPDNQLLLGAEDSWITDAFEGRLWIAVELLADGLHELRLERLEHLGSILRLPLVACGDVHMHCRQRRVLQDTLTAIREGVTLDQAGFALYPNGERYLRKLETLGKIYPPALLEESLAIASEIAFSLDELRYEYPDEIVPEGETPASYLRRLTEEGMQRRWPGGVPEKVRKLVEHELALIRELEYEAYFLTVYDIVAFARSRDILCQGRGSAANSAVCFCLGVTEVDPERMATLVERFISKERNEPPDIDVDFEHERREEVIQYLYQKYGRERAALAATVITYRPRSALRDVGKALGLSGLQVDRLAKSMQWWDGGEVDEGRVVEAGLDPDSPVIRRLLYLVRELLGFPRHLSQHVGGFVIANGPLSELVPVENAAMEDRTVIQWEKNDLEDLGLLKVDVLGLGMLTAIRRSFDLIRDFDGRDLTLATVPAEDPVVYDMICDGDTMGVFQIESRAQMAMLPRLKPRCYYDLVIEVAIIRPGPIQGDMVHPYLRRRNGEESVEYPSEAVREVLQRTLGVPIFQEQVMQLAVVAAGFTPGEADRLRRAMAAWKRRGGLGPFEEKLVRGMKARGYSEAFAKQIFQQILGFGEYGFPESHSASFALLVYVSCWLKCHTPAAFTCALLNSQPMGFYSASQLTQDARRHGVEVRPVDVNCSQWDSSLERATNGDAAMRLGLRQIKGLQEEAGTRIAEKAPYSSIQELAEKADLDRRELNVLAAAGAMASIAGHRHKVRWAAAGVEKPTPLLSTFDRYEALPMLKKPTEGQDIVADYQSLGLTLGRHPLNLIRDSLNRYRYVRANQLPELEPGEMIRIAGLVITKQRPGTASGVTFVTLEDETGCSNLVVWKKIADEQRNVLLNARLMGVQGELQREGKVIHVIARKLFDHSDMLGALLVRSRDFR